MTRIYINELKLRVAGDRLTAEQTGRLVASELLRRAAEVGEGKISDLSVKVEVAPTSSMEQTAAQIASAVLGQCSKTK